MVVSEKDSIGGSRSESGTSKGGKPVKADFKRGEVILYAGDRYEVLENHGESGTVKALNDGGVIVSNFRWEFDGERCVREEGED